MRRTIAVCVCCFALAACNSGFMQGVPSMPDLPSLASFDAGSLFGAQPVTIKIDSNPAGADATSSVGGGCRTPCSLVVKTTKEFVVTLALAGHQPQAVPVRILPPEDPRFASGDSALGARPDPEQIFVELMPVEPPRRTGPQSRR